MPMTAAAALLLPVAWAYSTSTHFCYPGEDDRISLGCPETWPETFCTLDLAKDQPLTLCKCKPQDVKGNSCIIDEVASSYTHGRCADIVVKVTSSTPIEVELNADLDDVPDVTVTEEIYCKNMVVNTAWRPYTRSGAVGEGDADFRERECWWNWGWWCWGAWECWWEGDTWENGKCYDKDRYLGEHCSDDLSCKTAPKSYDEYSTSCVADAEDDESTPKCVMFCVADAEERQECECNWFDWWIGFACASSTCNGHACVLTTGGGGGYYCDYATPGGGNPFDWFR